MTRGKHTRRGCRRKILHPPFFFFCGLLAAFSAVRAEDIHGLIDAASGSRISIGVGSMPSRTFQNYTGTFVKQMTAFSADLPLAGDALSLWSIHAALHTSAAQISLLPDQVSLLSGVVGISKEIFGGERDHYLISCGIGFASDDESLDQARFRFSGVGIGTHSLDHDFAILYGLSYSYVLGRGFILPVAGFHWKLSDDASLRALLPFLLRLHYRASERWSLGLKAALDGDRFQYLNEGNAFSAPRHVYIRLTQLNCGADFVLTLSPLLSLSGELGVAVARRLWISSDNGDFLSAKINPGGYAQAAARFSF